MSSGDGDGTLDGYLETVAFDDVTVAQDPGETIKPTRVKLTGDTERVARLITDLRSLGASELTAIEYERTLGEGGMAVVHLATQSTLGRKVAVKRLRRGEDDPGATESLLQEAWVTGALEHPNVVPIHTLGLDAQGAPCIVLKRIEGVTWTELMNDEEAVATRFGATDLLEWNLRVLMQVCNALHFAHSKGIVHRDLKPDNVMIGEFGEVYVLDWGIAVCITPDGSERFRKVPKGSELAGTPAYMAPEMLGLGSALGTISERTDVYLLGATLYQIATGSAPHNGRALKEIARSVLSSPPVAHAPASPELRAVIARAMALKSDDRYPSAEHVRLDIQTFLDRRAASRLAAVARDQLEHLLAALADEAANPAERRQRIYRHFGECRFGFRQSLESWPQNPSAQSGLRRAVESLVDFEIGAGSPEAAASLLAELPQPPPALVHRIDEALRLQKAEREQVEELKRLRQDLDPSIGQRTRLFLASVFGVLWIVGPLLAEAADEALFGGPSYYSAPMWAVLFLILVAGLGYWARDSMGKTAFNRRILGSLVFMFCAMGIWPGAAYLLGISQSATLVVNLLIWFLLSSKIAMLLEPRLWALPIGYFAGLFVAAAWPEQVYKVMSISNIWATALLALTWRRWRY